MNKTQGNYYQMYLSTQVYMDEKTTMWNSIPRIVAYKNDFNELITRISELTVIAHQSVGVTERKIQLKTSISHKLAILSGAIQAFAYETDNMDLLKKTKVVKSDVQRQKDTDLVAFVKAVLTLVEQYLSELADFGVTEQMLSEVNVLLDDFNSLIGKPRAIMNNKFVALSTLEQLFDETNGLLNNKLDKLMLMFEETGNGFYEGYKRSRTIVDR